MGVNAKEGEFPYQALVYNNFTQLICGGSIYNKRFIITAAHCLTDLENGTVHGPASIIIRVGLTRIDDQNAIERTAYKIHVHHLFGDWPMLICLLKKAISRLSATVKFAVLFIHDRQGAISVATLGTVVFTPQSKLSAFSIFASYRHVSGLLSKTKYRPNAMRNSRRMQALASTIRIWIHIHAFTHMEAFNAIIQGCTDTDELAWPFIQKFLLDKARALGSQKANSNSSYITECMQRHTYGICSMGKLKAPARFLCLWTFLLACKAETRTLVYVVCSASKLVTATSFERCPSWRIEVTPSNAPADGPGPEAITMGVNAKEGEFPYQALVYNNFTQLICAISEHK
ncbi:unnamed protein product [Trichogramma brassicae]|uniref:Peptidase S1 domain-containing protein n=1 Tax=Trichogramma brassicae TaxID=86971 RepID=A0A6H5J327_9HYME|nr:unnamed protein product [Trichogramma brassicae]